MKYFVLNVDFGYMTWAPSTAVAADKLGLSVYAFHKQGWQLARDTELLQKFFLVSDIQAVPGVTDKRVAIRGPFTPQEFEARQKVVKDKQLREIREGKPDSSLRLSVERDGLIVVYGKGLVSGLRLSVADAIRLKNDLVSAVREAKALSKKKI